METLREEEDELLIVQDFPHVRGIDVQIHAEPFQRVRAAALGGNRPVAVLDHLIAHARQSEGGAGGAVEGGTAVPARAHHFDVGAFDPVDAHGAGQRRTGGVGHFQRAFALHAQAHEEAPGLRGRHGPVHERGEPGRGHVRRQVLAAGEGFEDRVDGVGVLARGQDGLREVPEQAQALGREDGFRVELHADPRAILVA